MALLAAACTAGRTPPTEDLVVLDDSGAVRLVASADGTSRLLAAAGAENGAFQPTWTPDGRRVTYARTGPDPALVTVAVSDTARLEYPTSTAAFYFAWDPTGRALAWLRGDPDGSLLFEVRGGDRDLRDGGVPFYFSWSPDGSALAAHVGDDRLDRLGFTAANEVLETRPGLFQAPAWTSAGVVYLRRTRDGQELVRSRDGRVEPLATVPGGARFVATDRRIAVETFDPGGRPRERQGLAAAAGRIPELPTGRVLVLDAASGTVVTALDRPAAAFFWSPDGERLLLLDVVDRVGTFRWLVWDGTGLDTYAPFTADPGWFGNFVPFFDQYAQSMRLWSTGADAFAYPGTVDGEAGIWVQHLGEEAPRRVASGSWVAWSPRG